MGQCSSSAVGQDAIINEQPSKPEEEEKIDYDDEKSETHNKDNDNSTSSTAVDSLHFISEKDRKNYVRELAGVVLEGYRANLVEYENKIVDEEEDDVDWAQMDRVIDPLKAQFNPRMERIKHIVEQERTATTFLISRVRLQELGLTSYPKHEDALKMDGLLKRVEIDDMRMKLCREFNRGIHTHFISHKWDGNSPDTEDNAIFDMTKEAAHYMWFDYTCVPQDNHEERLQHLLSIANILHEATVITCHANDTLEKGYNHSVWCQLEAALLQWDKVQFQGGEDPNDMEWTIYDWNDLYIVLPGFLDLWVNSTKNHHFFDGKEGLERTKMVVSLLGAFIRHHDNECSEHSSKEEE